MNKKGYAIVLDSLFALTFALIILIGLTSYYQHSTEETSFKQLHYISEDVFDALNKEGVLDEVGERWAASNGSVNSTEWLSAENISKAYLEEMIPENIGYRLLIEDVTLAENTTRINEAEAPTKTNAERLLVGYGKGLPTRGQVSRTFLTNIQEKSNSIYSYFGGFVGQGNITNYIRGIPEDAYIQQACLELNVGEEFDLYVNDVLAGQFSPSGSGMIANIKGSSGCISDPRDYFTTGDNKYELRFTEGDLNEEYVGGGFLKVVYNTTEAKTEEDAKSQTDYLPGIRGWINYYSSIYIPGDIESMDAYLHYNSNETVYMTIGDTIVFNSSSSQSLGYCNVTNSTDYSCLLPDTNLSREVDYSDMGVKTVPISVNMGDISNSSNTDMILYEDSYIRTEYTPEDTSGYGELTFMLSTPPFNDTENCKGYLYVPEGIRVIDAKITSYSAQHWTDFLSVENIEGYHEPYRLWEDYGALPYSMLGDPFIVHAPPEYLPSNSNNTIEVGTGDDEFTRAGCSEDNRIIYTIKLKMMVDYGDVFPYAEGCNWNIEFSDGSSMTASIPSSYNGTDECYYNTENITMSKVDTIDDSIYRLLHHLDLDKDGRVDVIFDPARVNFELSRAGGVKSLWGPTKFKLVLWM